MEVNWPPSYCSSSARDPTHERSQAHEDPSCPLGGSVSLHACTDIFLLHLKWAPIQLVGRRPAEFALGNWNCSGAAFCTSSGVATFTVGRVPNRISTSLSPPQLEIWNYSSFFCHTLLSQGETPFSYMLLLNRLIYTYQLDLLVLWTL